VFKGVFFLLGDFEISLVVDHAVLSLPDSDFGSAGTLGTFSRFGTGTGVVLDR
jgi:hypothetical protein